MNFETSTPRVTPCVAQARGISHVFPNGVPALEKIDLDLRDGEFVAVMGPSGCGKSTLLRIIAGLIKSSSGHVFIGDDLALAADAARRSATSSSSSVGFVFQNPALLPWRTVRENALLPFELDQRLDSRLADRIPHLLEQVGLASFADTHPARLSGGMRMRAALVRALAPDPQPLLLDEPFAALDEITRQSLQELLLALRPHGSHASVLVTHNAFEAAFLASRVVVLSPRPGRIIAEFEVPFGNERAPSLRAHPEFAALVGRIMASIPRSLS